MNYIKEVTLFWDDAPYMDGYKSEYGLLYLALIDSVNRNFWKDTEIEYDRLINKTRLSKRVYLAGRTWLMENGFITFTAGRNDYAKAKFNVVVRNCTATDTTNDTAASTTTVTSDAPLLHHSSTAIDTATVSSTAPILNKTKKQETRKQEDEEGAQEFSSATPIEILVEDFKNSKKGDPPELRGSPLTLDDYETLLLDNRFLLETSCASLKISEEDFEKAVKKFIADKKATKYRPKRESDMVQYFMNWAPNRLWVEKEGEQKKGKLTKSLNTTVAAAEAIHRKGGLVTFADLQDL